MTLSEGLPLLQDPSEARHNEQRRVDRERQKKRHVAVALTIATLLAVTIAVVTRHDLPSSFRSGALATTTPYAEVLATYREAHDFDGVLQVRINGTVVYEAAGGIADEEFQVPMPVDAIFPIGSNAKLFTAVPMYQLQEQGLVNLSDPVNSYLNQDDFATFGVPNQTTWCPRVAGAAPDSPCENVTFVQLMHMASGIGDSFNCDNVDAAHCYRTADNIYYYKGSLGPYVGLFINDPLVFKPGTNYSYSNPNYVLLSYLVEKISGMRFATYIKLMITDKLGLNDTYYDPYSGGLGIHRRYVQQYMHYYVGVSEDAQGERVATGTCSPYLNAGSTGGSGGLYSTVSDMQRWYLDLFGNEGTTSKLLTPESIRMITERVNPIKPIYAQGVFVGARRGDGWPTALSYCGGMKCAVTCVRMLFPENRTDSSVVLSAFTNHMRMGFADRAAFESLRPTEAVIMPNVNTTVYDQGIIPLRVLIDAYYSTSP